MIAFSVVVMAYNHAAFLEERIASVLAQTHPHYEVILFDDASTDGSRDAMERYRHHPRVSRVLFNQTNNGWQSRNWLQAVQAAAHDWVWIAEGDDVADPGFLSTAAEALSQSGPALFYTDAYRLEAGKDKEQWPLYSYFKDRFFGTAHWRNDYTADGLAELDAFHKHVCIVNNVSAAVMPRQTALTVLENFPHKRFYSDWLFFAQLMERLSVVYSAAPLTYYRSHPQSHFGQDGNGLAKRIECFEVLQYFCAQPYVSNKPALVKFFTEQYLGFGLWEHRRWRRPLYKAFFERDKRLAAAVFRHLLYLKISRKKITYVF